MEDYISEIKTILSGNGFVDEESDVFIMDSNDFDHVAEQISELIQTITKRGF